MMNEPASKTCIVSVVIGPKYQEVFDRYSRKRLENYCTRHGYDLKILTEPVRELEGKKYTWQKLLLPECDWWRSYDQVVFMDSDIVVAKDAPALPVVSSGKIGGVPDKLPYQMNSGVWIAHPDEEIESCFTEALEDQDPFWDQKALTRVMLHRYMDEPIDGRFNRQVYFKCWSFLGTLFRRHWFYHACHGKLKLPFIHAWLTCTFR
jgi:hypothetical protein